MKYLNYIMILLFLCVSACGGDDSLPPISPITNGEAAANSKANCKEDEFAAYEKATNHITYQFDIKSDGCQVLDFCDPDISDCSKNNCPDFKIWVDKATTLRYDIIKLCQGV